MSSVGLAAIIAQRASGVRFDPYGAYNFYVEIEGILAGGFSEVSGLEISTEVETIREGGVNNFEYKLPKITTYSNIVLNYGVTAFDLIWNWYADVLEGNIKRKNGSIYILDNTDVPVMWWNFYDAWPVQWAGPSFNASDSVIAVESLTLAHHGIKKSKLSQFVSAATGVVSKL